MNKIKKVILNISIIFSLCCFFSFYKIDAMEIEDEQFNSNEKKITEINDEIKYKIDKTGYEQFNSNEEKITEINNEQRYQIEKEIIDFMSDFKDYLKFTFVKEQDFIKKDLLKVKEKDILGLIKEYEELKNNFDNRIIFYKYKLNSMKKSYAKIFNGLYKEYLNSIAKNIRFSEFSFYKLNKKIIKSLKFLIQKDEGSKMSLDEKLKYLKEQLNSCDSEFFDDYFDDFKDILEKISPDIREGIEKEIVFICKGLRKLKINYKNMIGIEKTDKENFLVTFLLKDLDFGEIENFIEIFKEKKKDTNKEIENFMNELKGLVFGVDKYFDPNMFKSNKKELENLKIEIFKKVGNFFNEIIFYFKNLNAENDLILDWLVFFVEKKKIDFDHIKKIISIVKNYTVNVYETVFNHYSKVNLKKIIDKIDETVKQTDSFDEKNSLKYNQDALFENFCILNKNLKDNDFNYYEKDTNGFREKLDTMEETMKSIFKENKNNEEISKVITNMFANVKKNLNYYDNEFNKIIFKYNEKIEQNKEKIKVRKRRLKSYNNFVKDNLKRYEKYYKDYAKIKSYLNIVYEKSRNAKIIYEKRYKPSYEKLKDKIELYLRIIQEYIDMKIYDYGKIKKNPYELLKFYNDQKEMINIEKKIFEKEFEKPN